MCALITFLGSACAECCRKKCKQDLCAVLMRVAVWIVLSLGMHPGAHIPFTGCVDAARLTQRIMCRSGINRQ